MSYFIKMFIFRFVFLLYLNYVLCGSDETNWWRDTVIYQIYPRSFMDSDGDGVGDLNGITSKLNYLQDLGVESLYIPYLYETSNRDSDTYEITDHKAIDPLIGTMDDFHRLLEELKKRGMYIIIDFVPNHTSIDHKWFKESQNQDSDYKDYYVWRNPKGYDWRGDPEGPNNWQSLNGYYGWQYIDTNGKFFYHLYSHRQPDLNLKNYKVVDEIMEILQFWLNKGVDGVVIKNVDYLIEDEWFRDNYYSASNLIVNHAKGKEESYELVGKLRSIIEKYERKNGRKRIAIAETESLKKFFYNGIYISGELGLSGRVLSQHIRNAGDSSAAKLASHINKFMGDQPYLTPIVWSTELHNERRIPSMYDEESVDIVNALTLLLPGVGFTYYGQELGLKGVHDNNWDKYSSHLGILKEDPDAKYTERFPMSWNDSFHAGFTTAEKPWYPVSPDYWRLNVESQKSECNSHLNFYKGLINLRKSPEVKDTHVHVWKESKDIIAFSRCNGSRYLFYVLINLSNETVVHTLVDQHYFLSNVKKILRVKLSSTNALQKKGDVMKSNCKYNFDITMRPRSIIIFSIEKDENAQ